MRSSGQSAGQDTPEAEALTVETDGISRRAVQITREPNGVGTFFLSADGQTVYFTGQDDRGAGLFSISLDGGDTNRLASGGFRGITPTQDRTMVFFRPGPGPGAGFRRGAGARGGAGAGTVSMMPLRGGNLQNRQERIEFDRSQSRSTSEPSGSRSSTRLGAS